MGPLHGIRIIDMTSVLMGPFASQALGDMGADVVKIEAPAGDLVRQIGPARHEGMGPIFLNANRNKRSVVLDLKRPEGVQALKRLLVDADVLMTNVRPQAMARLGLDYEVVSAINPRLVYAGLFGFGQDGPYAARPAYDDLIQGAVGIPSLVARVGDGTPRYVPVTMVDRTVGTTAVGAIAAALYRREKRGVGQSIEVPMFETMVPFVLGEHLAGESYDPPLGPAGYSRLLARERTPFPTRDGYVCALIYTDQHWRAFFRELGEPERFDADPRLADIGAHAAPARAAACRSGGGRSLYGSSTVSAVSAGVSENSSAGNGASASGIFTSGLSGRGRGINTSPLLARLMVGNDSGGGPTGSPSGLPVLSATSSATSGRGIAVPSGLGKLNVAAWMVPNGDAMMCLCARASTAGWLAISEAMSA